MEQIRLDHQLPVKKTDHTSKGDMRDSRRHWCLIYCKKALFPTRLSCISLFGLHTAALSAVAVPVLIF